MKKNNVNNQIVQYHISMLKTVSAYEARTNLGELINLVYYNDFEIVIERMGKPVVKIVGLGKNKFKYPKKNILSLAGIWNNKDGEIIEKNINKFRSNFRLISS